MRQINSADEYLSMKVNVETIFEKEDRNQVFIVLF